MLQTSTDASDEAGKDSKNAHARTVALAAAARHQPEPAARIDYHSAGRVLIIGDAGDALEVTRRLAAFPELQCTLLLSCPEPVALTPQDKFTVLYGNIQELTGYLGAFSATLTTATGEVTLASLLAEDNPVDLVLDLDATPCIQQEILPPGYFAPGNDQHKLEELLTELPQLVGDFEKPRYFHYDSSICAHGRSGLVACTRCLDSCPTGAISSLGEQIEVDPGLCQGAGSCATACPSGAISYSYPHLQDALQKMRSLLKTYREAGGEHPWILFYDLQSDSAIGSPTTLPAHILPIQVEEVGCVGMDQWLSAFAWGAERILLLLSHEAPPTSSKELYTQQGFAHALLKGIGYPLEALAFSSDIDTLLRGPGLEILPAQYAPMNAKRTAMRLALDHLYAQAPEQRPMISLPAGAPFGEVWVDKQRCTLCMACVSQCPSHALQAGSNTPLLNFIEENCVQCTLCCRSCPEDAITISPRYLFDAGQRRQPRTLYEDEPFDCIRCGQPFATRAVIKQITQRLQGHAMFQGEALQRIQMCEDCRVKALFDTEEQEGETVIPGDHA